MQNHSTDQLDVEVAHFEDAFGHLAGDRESFGQKIIKGFTAADAFAKRGRFSGQLFLGQRKQGGFKRIDFIDQWLEATNLSIVGASENLTCERVNHRAIPY